MTVSNELIDQLLAGYKKPEDLIGENGLLKQLTKRLVERALKAEMTEHLGHTKNASVANAAGNAPTAKAKRLSKATLANYPSTFPVTAIPALSLRSCPSTRLAGRALTTRSCPCTPVA